MHMICMHARASRLSCWTTASVFHPSTLLSSHWRTRGISRPARAMAQEAGPSPANIKPPNVLVLQPQGTKQGDHHFAALKEGLASCLNQDRYVIYPLGLDDVLRTPWKENCSLFVVPSKLTITAPLAFKEIMSFVHRGGILLSMEASLNMVLGFKGHACLALNHLYTAISDHSGRFHALGISPTGMKDVHFAQEIMVDPAVSRNVLAHFESTSQLDMSDLDASSLPCVQKAIFKSGGKAIISYVDLLSTTYKDADVSTLVQLKKDVESRHGFLRTALNGVGLECSLDKIPNLSHTYLVCSQENRTQFLSAMSTLKQTEHTIKGSEMDIHLIQTDIATEGTPVDPLPEPTRSCLSVITRPAKWQLDRVQFCFKEYFDHLRTAYLGRTVLYTPVVSSTQTVFTGNMPFCTALKSELGAVCVAGQQTQGKGRSGNFWISPKGAMMFSMPLKFPPWSQLYRRMPLLQHIVALAVVAGVRSLPGYEVELLGPIVSILELLHGHNLAAFSVLELQEVPIAIKWPNDIYYRDQVKLGGILVSCFTVGTDTTMMAVVGCGVNISNKYPTMSFNDGISLHNASMGTSLPPLTIEQTLAATLNKLEMFLGQYEALEFKAVEALYYKYWLHSGVTVQLASRSNEEVTIMGIDEFGYLRVKCASGEELSLQPDGNSFDIMKGLIAMK